MEKDKIGIKGQVRLQCFRKDGSLKWDTGFMRNTITTASLAIISGLVGNTGSEVAFTYLAVGTDNTAESDAHTALQAETSTNGLERAAATVSQETTAETDDTLQLTKTWTATGTIVVEEVGAFNAGAAGTMLGRKLTTTKTVNNAEQLVGTYQFIFS